MRADRLLQIVDLLRRHERLSATELARRLEVTPRTVHRDMEALSAAGVPVYAERGRRGGYALVPGYRPSAEDLTEDEAKALFLAVGSATTEALGIDPDFQRALRKLSTAMPEPHARSVGQALERVLFDPDGWSGAGVEQPPELSAVLAAVDADRRLRVTYRPRGADRTRVRTLDPWGLVWAAGTWYLVAAHRGRPRTYRLDRMSQVQQLRQRAHRPEGLDLSREWTRLRAQWRDQPSVAVRIRVRRAQADLAVRQLALVLAAPVERSADGVDHEVLETRVTTLRGVVGVLLGFGDWVEALEPPELRTLMVEVASEALGVHSGPLRQEAAPSVGTGCSAQ